LGLNFELYIKSKVNLVEEEAPETKKNLQRDIIAIWLNNEKKEANG